MSSPTPARDQAVDFTHDLLSVVFKRLWLPPDRRIAENLVDHWLAAVAEHIGSEREAEEALEELADDAPLFEMRPDRRVAVSLPRRN